MTLLLVKSAIEGTLLPLHPGDANFSLTDVNMRTLNSAQRMTLDVPLQKILKPRKNTWMKKKKMQCISRKI